MAKTPGAVVEFLKECKDKLAPVATKAKNDMISFRRNDNASTETAYQWDWNFYRAKMLQAQFNHTADLPNPWLPAEHTFTEVLNMYSELFGFQFRKIEGQEADRLSPNGNGSDLVWHPDVEVYPVWNEDDGLAGFLYLDLYERDGKPPKSNMFPLELGFILSNNTRHYPTVFISLNFAPSSLVDGVPVFIGSGDLRYFFHELGHAMHQLSCEVRWSAQCGPNGVPNDFVEMPSQMMEVGLPSLRGSSRTYELQLTTNIFTSSLITFLNQSCCVKSVNIGPTSHPKPTRPGIKCTPTRINSRKQCPTTLLICTFASKISWIHQLENWQISYDMELHTPATHDAALALRLNGNVLPPLRRARRALLGRVAQPARQLPLGKWAGDLRTHHYRAIPVPAVLIPVEFIERARLLYHALQAGSVEQGSRP
jgi:hypothetical protein